MCAGFLKIYNICIGMVVLGDHERWGVTPWGGWISCAIEEYYCRGILMAQLN